MEGSNIEAKEYAEYLVDKFKNVLQDEDTECGCEILCTKIAIENAKITIDELMKVRPNYRLYFETLIELNKI